MAENDALAEGHEPQDKGLQLGVDPDNVTGDDRTYVENAVARESIWEDATTVEGFALELLELAGEEPDVVAALKEARENG